jgi:GxxExxY protein
MALSSANSEADMVVEGKILLELKAIQTLVAAHKAQLVNYLTATGIDIGLLVNFGAPSLQFKRKTRLFPKPPGPEITL